MVQSVEEFSFRTREKSLQRFRDETFDFLVIGGGITGAAVARDAVSRGLSVALVERKDFAFGTSSRSSKLIHGGLRYLQNFELGLVFEALAERALLLKTIPQLVRPLPFYLPVYEGDSKGRSLLSLGLWLYDLLALFRTPGFHQKLSRDRFLSDIPFVKAEGLLGGFRYFDASMWDDVLTVQTLRSAYQGGAAVANYVEAIEPLWQRNRIIGYKVRDQEKLSENDIQLKAHRTIVCAGPWTDQVGSKLSREWGRWLNPSKGVHLIFELNRIPVPGAMVMAHPEDGRISFVIPRPDYGAGVVIVGTTDAPTDDDPDKAEIRKQDVDYLLNLVNLYFPSLKVTHSDILSGYVGVRPLMGGESPKVSGDPSTRNQSSSSVLQKVSREHHIAQGPGGTVVVAGGKYTTHRKMGEEVVDFALRAWRKDCQDKGGPFYPSHVGKSKTRVPVNHRATSEAIQSCREEALKNGVSLPEELLSRYGADMHSILEIEKKGPRSGLPDPEGFPALVAQLRYAIRKEMVLHLEDFYLRRIPLFLSRRDHGLPWVDVLARAWAQERGGGEKQIREELAGLKEEFTKRSRWLNK